MNQKPEERFCVYCGKRLEKWGVFWRKYCSNACRQADYRKRKQESERQPERLR